MLYADMKTYLVELLMKQDQMSMASSIEARVPFLDAGLVEFAATIPERLKIHGMTHKYILKQVARGFLPSRIVDRKKLGFPTPLRQWFSGPGAESLLSKLWAEDGFLASYIDMGEVRRLIDAHRSGQVDGTDRLWRLLNLQIWGDIFLSGKSEPWDATHSYQVPSVAV
jgi:asparagine synthase (glutamine-hydrolysing)